MGQNLATGYFEAMSAQTPSPIEGAVVRSVTEYLVAVLSVKVMGQGGTWRIWSNLITIGVNFLTTNK